MRVSVIAAVSANNVIGVAGGLPWRLPEDLRRFKELTMGKPMLMGRLTYESIGKALPGRRSIILSRQIDFQAEGCEVVTTVDAAIAAAGDVAELMVIGGGNIYEQLLPESERIYLTRVHTHIEGDVFFPEIDPADWRSLNAENFPATTDRQYGFTFETLERLPRSSTKHP
jgi:dihydrofolate reductase